MPLMAYGEQLHADGRLESFLLTEELAGYCELQEFIERRFPVCTKRLSEKLPSPSGRGAGGEGGSRSRVAKSGQIGTDAPHPGPLPKGEGDQFAPFRIASNPSPQPSPGGRGGCSAALRRLVVQVADIARRFHAAGFNHRDFYCCHFLTKETWPGQFDVRLIDLQRVQKRRWLRRRWIVKDLAQLAAMSPDDRVGCREKVLFLRTYLGVRKLRAQDKRLVRDVLRKLSLIRRRARHKP